MSMQASPNLRVSGLVVLLSAFVSSRNLLSRLRICFCLVEPSEVLICNPCHIIIVIRRWGHL